MWTLLQSRFNFLSRKYKVLLQEIWTYFVVVVQLLSHVWLFATPRTAAHQYSLPFTISHTLLILMSIESMMPSNHLLQHHSSKASVLQCSAFFMSSVSSVAQSCPALCDPMNPSTPGLPVHHQLPEFTQTHVHWVGDAIQLSHPLLFPSLPAPNPSPHQSLFQWVNSLHEVAKVLEFQL